MCVFCPQIALAMGVLTSSIYRVRVRRCLFFFCLSLFLSILDI